MFIAKFSAGFNFRRILPIFLTAITRDSSESFLSTLFHGVVEPVLGSARVPVQWTVGLMPVPIQIGTGTFNFQKINYYFCRRNSIPLLHVIVL